MSTFWQVASGSFGRNYAPYFLKYGIAFVGGEAQIKKMSEVKLGDIIAIKNGTKTIVAVGKVVERNGKYKGNKDLKWLYDLDGWELPAYCYVDWKEPQEPQETKGLTRSTIQRIHQGEHKKLIENILSNGKTVEHQPEPKETSPVSDDRLLKFLIREGLRPTSADELTQTIMKIRLLADYYYNNCKWEDVKEHETRTFLVIPLLIALGWSEQQIKIELKCNKGRIDIACFKNNYKKDNNKCLSIIETKGFSSGLDYAPKQALAYSKDFPNCKVIIVTNGYCYKVYLRGDNDCLTLSAYLNILNPMDKYPLDPKNVEGALEAIKWLLPNSLT